MEEERSLSPDLVRSVTRSAAYIDISSISGVFLRERSEATFWQRFTVYTSFKRNALDYLSRGGSLMQATKAFLHHHAVGVYFSVVLLISWGAGLIVEGSKLIRRQPIQPTDALLLFPIIVLSVALTGIALLSIVDGKRGLRDLLSRMGRWRVSVGWYVVALLTAPALLLAVLFTFSTLISPVFTPKLNLFFILFGIFPGVVEEMGWTGFALPKMRLQHSALGAGILLGL